MSDHCPMIIGITGGLGSGKSSVAGILDRRGAAVIDADEIARRLLRPGKAVFDEVVEEFGHDLLTANGEIDRRRLAEKVFQDPAARRRLEDIVHPAVLERIRSKIASYRRRPEDGPEVIALDVPLLFEVGMQDWCDEVWAVWCDLPQRIERLTRRDGLTECEIRERIAAQIPLREKMRRADRTIDNTGSEAELVAQVDRILEQIETGDSDVQT